ncbi:hypothetical protein SLEP1_g45959 [Rubroshorea leprosula]|uniref:Secreted protein n=1 Tax=Rubroshorea leprosula TaxID=152421 RepID=A0AAV5LKP9_9ROSI|nr:hypothetical protein SLEP1_g45959 [Rubroshorea leprosula]
MAWRRRGVTSYLFFLCILRYSSYNHPCCVARCREMQVRNAYASQKLKVYFCFKTVWIGGVGRRGRGRDGDGWQERGVRVSSFTCLVSKKVKRKGNEMY